MDNTISLRIITIDYCMCAPIPSFDATYSEFRAAPVNQVPIIRIFGSKSTGEKICLHIHGVYPYFYIPYDGTEEPNSLMYRIATSIDKAVNVSFNQSSSTVQHVYKVSLVSGIPMYGYHRKKHQFFKIYLYNPLLVNKISSLMFNDTTLGKIYQPHETHLNFTLQFMIDYNLHGMNNINLSEFKLRDPLSSGNTVQRTTSCQLEADAQSRHILNREEVCAGKVTANPGIAALWADERQRRRDHGGQSQLGAFLGTSRCVPPTASHNAHKNALLERLYVWVTGVDKEEICGNDSVYPAETPDGANIQHSSLIDSDLPSSTDISSLNESSLNDTLQVTLCEVTMDNDVTMDDAALEMLKILKELERSIEERKEDDCILSQVIREVEEDEDEKEVDMTLPLESIITPNNSPRQDLFSDDTANVNLDTTLIPQLDGQCLDNDEDTSRNANPTFFRRNFGTIQRNINRRRTSKSDFVPKACYIRLIDCRCANKSMPLLDENYAFDDHKDKRVGSKLSSVEFKTQFHDPHLETDMHREIPRLTKDNGLHKPNIRDKISNNFTKNVNRNFRSGGNIVKRSEGKHTTERWKAVKFGLNCVEEEVRVFEMRVKKMNRRDHVSMLMKKIHKKDRDMALLLSSNRQPKFNVVPSTKNRQSTEERVSTVNAIHYVATRISSYIEPTLHLTIEYPTKQMFHYSYQGGRYFPLVQNIQDDNNIKLVPHIEKNFNIGYDCSKNVVTEFKSTCIGNSRIVCRETAVSCKANKSQEEEKSFGHDLTLEMRNESNSEFKTRHIENKNLVSCKRPSGLVGNNDIVSCKHSKGVKRKKEESFDNNKSEINATYIDNNLVSCELSSRVKRIKYQEQEESLGCKFKCNNNNNPNSELKAASVENNNIGCYFTSCIERKKIEQVESFGSRLAYTELVTWKASNCFKRKRDPDEDSFGCELACKMDNTLSESQECIKNYEDCCKKSRNSKTAYITDIQVAGNSSCEDGMKQYQLKQSTSKNCRAQKSTEKATTANKINSLVGNAKLKCQYLSLDGIIDSSDDENCDKQMKSKRSFVRTKSDDNTRYDALPISISQTSKSGKEDEEQEVLGNSDMKLSAECGLPKLKEAKRKLKFHCSYENGVNNTIIEERLDCIYSPVRRESVKLKRADPRYDYEDKIDAEDRNGKSHLSPKYFNQTPEEHNSGFNSHDSDIKDGEAPLRFKDHNSGFGSDRDGSSSCDEVLNTSFFNKLQSEMIEVDKKKKKHKKGEEMIPCKRLQISAAARYDAETSYKAKEGCSTVFTPPVSQKSTQSSDDSKFGMLTPYQAPVFMPDDEHSSELFSSGHGQKIIIYEPLKKAPSRKEVLESLDFYKIPHIKFEEPYYSNWEDVTGSVEVGYNVLMIKSKSTVNLPEFESQTDALNTFRRYRLGDQLQKKTNMNKVLLSYCKTGDVITTPVKKPPTFKTVVEWMKQKNEDTKKPIKSKPEKMKLHVPLSPEGDNPELDLSLTLTPCSSPSTTQSNPNQNQAGSTSPTFGNICKKRKTEIRERLLGTSQNSQYGRSCEITGLTASDSLDFDKSVENLKCARAVLEHQNLTLLVMELHVTTRGEFRPDPAYDPIEAIFYSILNDVPENSGKAAKCRGAIVVNALPASSANIQYPILNGIGIDCDITYVSSEQELLEEFVKFVIRCDPDIVAGYEIQMLSWGYLIDRGNTIGINLKSELGRSKSGALIRSKEDVSSKDLRLIGRIVLDVWRIMRHEIAIQSYTFESIVYHILQKRVPYYSFKELTFWWSHRSNLYRHRTASYYLYRVATILDLFDKLDLIGRTSELARLFGIQFYEVLSRGSQFRVESMMLRLAKPLNFIPVSPSVQQRAGMQAPEYIPLLLEPESKMYNDPVIVLDFQSLYPSIIIAYNYCFTTCLGRVKSLGRNTPFNFGATQLKVSRARLEKLIKKDLLNFSPCGVAFVNKEVRDGIMPRMLREILDTRLMVKNSMKENKDDSVLQKVLHNRQLGLKLIANVTYGYTAANFSGRMPAVELGDSVVSKGRETLQRAIDLVENTPEWGARVVYGDTDSLFVCVPGRSRERAFEVGALIAEAVTNSNPDPVKLKLEKVYQPCILQTKKRYAGYMYESPDQKEPVFEAKGIETVRRDGCPAVSKMLEKCLRILFDTKDVSLVKKYTMRQFNKILAGRVSIQDLTFAKEYRGANGYAQRACVPALELARKWYTTDRRSEPRSGERVPYVVVNGPPGLPIIKLVRSVRDLLSDQSLRLNAQYYITRVIIPPLNRCFQLIGADISEWFRNMPRRQTQFLLNSVSPGKKSTISQYFATTNCVACGEHTKVGICDKCTSKPQHTVVTLMEKMRHWEECYQNIVSICQTCTLTQTEVKCISLDCPVYYRRVQTEHDVQQTECVRNQLSLCDF